MKFRSIILTMGIFTGLLGALGVRGQSTIEKKNNNPTFQEQLNTFRDLGFVLNPGIDTSEILRWPGGQKEFEEHPYALMYQTLGQTTESDPWTPLTDKCWDFDLEAIEDHGAYVYIMKNISRITNGELKFENLDDYVDVEKKKAWVSFTCNGDTYKWNLKVNDDWADGSLFDKVQELAVKYNTKGRFTFYNTGGQDFVLGYCTNEELENIKLQTGLDIVWLKAKGQIY